MIVMDQEEKNVDEGWQFRPEGSPSAPEEQPSRHEVAAVSWTGSEFISQEKSAMWYLALFGALGLICGGIYLVAQDVISIVFILIMGVLFAIVASKKPRQLQYSIDQTGLRIGQKFYPLHDFKSFSVQKDGAIGYVNLLPLKRFHPELSVYYAPEDEDKIVGALSDQLPFDQRPESMVDRLLKQIRF